MLTTTRAGFAGLVVALIAGLTIPGAVAGPPTERRATYKPTLKASHATVLSHSKLVLSGKVKPATKGATVLLQKRVLTGDRKWDTEARLKLTKKGTFTYTDKPNRVGVRYYRVVVPKVGTVKAGKTKAVKVTVYAWRTLDSIPTRKSEGTQGFYPGKIAGKSYYPSYGPQFDTAQGFADWNLDPTCKTLRVRFGNGDDSDEGATAHIVLKGDAAVLYANSFGLTQSEAKTFDITDVFRLTYSWTSTVSGSEDPAPGAQPLLAQPELLCAS